MTLCPYTLLPFAAAVGEEAAAGRRFMRPGAAGLRPDRRGVGVWRRGRVGGRVGALECVGHAWAFSGNQ